MANIFGTQYSTNFGFGLIPGNGLNDDTEKVQGATAYYGFNWRWVPSTNPAYSSLRVGTTNSLTATTPTDVMDISANGNIGLGGAITNAVTLAGATMVLNNGNVGIGTTTPGKLFSVGENLWQADVNVIEWNNGEQTSVNGLTGTAVWSQPFQGSAYKKFLVCVNGFTSAGTTITFPTAFSVQPTIYGDAAAIAIAVTTTTTVTLTAVGATAGLIFIEGY